MRLGMGWVGKGFCEGCCAGGYMCGRDSVGVYWEIIDLFILKDGRLRLNRMRVSGMRSAS